MLHIKNVEELKVQWEEVQKRLSSQFDADLDLQGILFLIGVQELGQGFKKFTKDQKQDLMHIATCRLLSIYGYYKLEGVDDEGWPQANPCGRWCSYERTCGRSDAAPRGEECEGKG